MGFTTTETMSGSHELADGTSHPFVFRVHWGPERLRDWLNPLSERFGWQELHGEVKAGGLFDWTPCQGTLELDYLRKRRIRYRFDVKADGRTLRFVGDKVDIKPWNLATSHTTCFGTLIDADTGELVSRSVTHFRWRTLPGFLLAFSRR